MAKTRQKGRGKASRDSAGSGQSNAAGGVLKPEAKAPVAPAKAQSKPKWIRPSPAKPTPPRASTTAPSGGADVKDAWVSAASIPLVEPSPPALQIVSDAARLAPKAAKPLRGAEAAKPLRKIPVAPTPSAPMRKSGKNASPPAAVLAVPPPPAPAIAAPKKAPAIEPSQLVLAKLANATAVQVKPEQVEPPQVEPAQLSPPKIETSQAAQAKASPPRTEASAGAAFGVSYPAPNVEILANNIARALEQAGNVFSAYLRPRETGAIKSSIADDMGEMTRTLGQVAEYYFSDPKRAFEAQTALTGQFINLWASTLQRFQGGQAAPVAEPDKSDKRFADAQWRDNPFFDFLKQSYVLTTRWADSLVRRADALEPHTRDKAQFYLRQVSAALSPSNFVGTNPELLRATLEESGENLVRGMTMLAEDIEAGNGNLRIRQVDAKGFELGVNMAVTPGKVVFRNELIELIQYAPSTPEVYKRPLLIVPPWINKFYILDLNPEKSFIRWAVSQGLTVFVVSWVNPDARLADKGFDAYMREGILAALDAVEQATGERDVTAIGYCVGGTLLAATLAYMAAGGDERIGSATFFTTQIDFTDAGDLKVFVDAEQLKAVEERMAEHGYLEGSAMANAFNMLRPNDLIWSYYVNNYLKGKEPMPFDLLVWNSDSTRMPAANHQFYLRNCYFQNDLANGRMELEGVKLDLRNVKIPVYELAAKEDHIAPARSVFTGAKCFGGPVRYVMAGSGHIAGVVNPPTKPKYQYWSGGPPEGDFLDWVEAAKETPGSWWPDWIRWIGEQAPEKVPLESRATASSSHSETRPANTCG